ncbi:MAG: acyl-protein synthetase [bacterium]
MTDFKASPEPNPLKGRTATDRLIETPPFDHGPKASGLFLTAMKEAVARHIKNCAAFRGLCRMQCFTPTSLKSPADIPGIPFISVHALKERELRFTKKGRTELELTSSGTTGQKSRILLDAVSLLRVRRMAWQVFKGLDLVDDSRTADYICFTYDPDVAKNLGTAWTDRLLTGFTKTGEIYWAFKWDRAAEEFRFDIVRAVEVLERYERNGRPVRIIGFPAFALRLVEEFRKKHGRNAHLNPDSKVITGGGWKNEQDKAVDKQIMRADIAGGLGLPPGSVRDLFGMVEHGVPYVDCVLGNFHIPVYSMVIARDPATLKPLPSGSTGLLQFLTPYLTSYPSISLLSGDFGMVREKCRCGLKGSILHITGRAGVKKLKGCAIAASTML